MDGDLCTASAIVDAIACVQLAAVLHQVDVRVKDLGLYGYYWLQAAQGLPFLEVGKQTLGNINVYHSW